MSQNEIQTEVRQFHITKRMLIAVLLVVCLQSNGQYLPASAAVPRFNILLIDGSRFTYRDLQNRKPLLLLYFAPECDHCRKFIGKLRSGMKDFRHVQIIMVSYFPLKSLHAFSDEFKLDQFPNIRVGTEGNSFFLPSYFKIETFPFIAAFNGAGKLTAIFRKEPLLEKIAEAVKK